MLFYDNFFTSIFEETSITITRDEVNKSTRYKIPFCFYFGKKIQDRSFHYSKKIGEYKGSWETSAYTYIHIRADGVSLEIIVISPGDF